MGQIVPHRPKEEPCHRQEDPVMLVLSRKQTEKVFINDNVVVTVVSIQRNKVRLGIQAPIEMPVYRGEVHERIWNPDVPRSVD
jgi:carbon storage regulator